MKTEKEVEISIVIPVYNEAENIASVLDEIVSVMENLGRSYEIVVVDDGSKDSSFEVLKRYHEEKPQIKVIRLTRNFGQHPAVYAGFSYACGKILLSMDGDGQNPPEEIPNLIKVLEGGNYDFVQGWRTQRKDSGFRRFFSQFVNWFIKKMTGAELKDAGCGMAVYSRNAVKRLLQATHHSRYIPAEISWMGLKIKSQPITHRKREKGKSRYRIWSLFWINFDIIASISTVPVEAIGFIGMVFSLLGFLLGLFIFIRTLLLNKSVDSFVIITSLLLIFVGIQILCISVLCAYVSRVYREVQHRPYFIVMETLTDDPHLHSTN
ncbi:MAG: glycosyltransferase family 2 protein [Candidatus Hydrogenedens sp.]